MSSIHKTSFINSDDTELVVAISHTSGLTGYGRIPVGMCPAGLLERFAGGHHVHEFSHPILAEMHSQAEADLRRQFYSAAAYFFGLEAS